MFARFVLNFHSGSSMTRHSQYDLQGRTKHELMSKTYRVPFQAWLVHAGTTMHIVIVEKVCKPIIVDVLLFASATKHE